MDMSGDDANVRGAASGEPWWVSKLVIAVVAGAFAAVGPVMTRITENGRLDLVRVETAAASELKAREQEHTTQLAFFEKAIDPGRPNLLRLSVLKFLSTSERVAPDVRAWAVLELPEVKHLLEREADEKARALTEAAKEYNAQQAELSRGPASDAGASEARRAALTLKQEHLQRLSREIAASRLAVRATEGKGACKTGAMQSDLRSGIGETEGSRLCAANAPRHAAGEMWIEQWEGRVFQCVCRR